MMKNRKKLLLATLALPFWHTGAMAADEKSVSFTSGLDYSSGDYGALIDTNILYVPVGVKYQSGEWSFSASSGFIHLEGPGGVIPGGDNGPIIAPDRRRVTEISVSGIGDTYLAATYSPEIGEDSNLYFDFTAKVKLPTASESKSLGTGKTDFTVQGDIAKLVGDFMPFGTLGYRMVGKPDDFTLKNVFYASVGTAYYFTPQVSLGSSYDFRQASSPFTVDGHEIFTYLNFQTRGDWGVSLYNVIGLSNNSPDFALGLQFTVMAF